jgi:hypothetical protein
MAVDTEIEKAVEGGQQPPPDDKRLFTYATWVHIGPGAENCEALTRDEATGDVTDASGCGDASHFHAWCRLPNQVQHEDIHVKAMAAKARHIRLLRDETTDEAVVLDADLDDMRAAGDSIKEPVVEEILQKTFWTSYVEATHDVNETENDAGEKIYEHVVEDQARFTDLRAMSEEERAGEQAEYEELVRHLAEYNDAIHARHAELREPEKQALMDRDLDSLLKLLRDDRVNRAADKVLMNTYSRWEWLVCTLDKPRGQRRFKDMEALSAAAPEVLEVLEDTFNDLEQSRNAGAAGNG